MAGQNTYEVKFRLNGSGDNRSTVKASDSAEAERIVKKNHPSQRVDIIDVRKR